jgi:hypothetical protein
MAGYRNASRRSGHDRGGCVPGVYEESCRNRLGGAAQNKAFLPLRVAVREPAGFRNLRLSVFGLVVVGLSRNHPVYSKSEEITAGLRLKYLYGLKTSHSTSSTIRSNDPKI